MVIVLIMSGRNKSFLLLLAFAGSGASAIAQKGEPDPSYIREFPGTITVRTFLGEKISGFNLIDGQHAERLRYRPNNVLGLGFGTTIRGFGINISTRLPFHNDKEERYGKTTQLDLQVHRYRGKFALDIYFQRYSGFHLADSSDVTAVVGNTDYPYFPDMKSITAGASGLYVFNGRRFSLRAPIDQQDWQVRSAGSWLLGGSVFAHVITNNEQSFIPPYLKRADFMSGHRVSKIQNYSATVNGGYGYNYIIREHYFLGLSADVGVGLGYSEIKDEGGTSHKLGLQLNGNARVAFGYNSRKWFSGFYIIFREDRFDLPFDQSFATSNEGIARLTVARRIITRKKHLGGLSNQ